jgi:aspartyl-tRNA(Asn)/glutamyl-tRNA(Gln) amidotransferase subunit A
VRARPVPRMIAAVSARGVTDPADLGLLDAVAALGEGALSARELLAACRGRIAERNGGEPTFHGSPQAINAFARLYDDVAEAQAREADKRRAREGRRAPALCGVPIGLKDLFAVAGLPLTASSRVMAGHVADRTAPAWQRLRADGMVLVGHTHTHPWDLARSAGGSSGGSGAALAAAMVPACLGTDTAGSLRIPASLCGVSAIKPTHGRVPMRDVVPLAVTLDHAGPMARSLADCGALLTTLARGGAEPTPLMPPPAPLGELPTAARPGPRPLQGVTVALTERPEAVGVEPDVADALDHARRACEELGARVVQLTGVGDLPADDVSAILFSEVGEYHERHAAALDRYRTSIREFVELGRTFTDAAAYLRAQRRRAGVTAAWERWFADHDVDVVLEPTTKCTAPLRGAGYDSGRLGGDGDPLIELTATWNVTGFPVAALPAAIGARSGLPVGISLIAPRGAEARVLQVGIDLQQRALPPLGPPPPASKETP